MVIKMTKWTRFESKNNDSNKLKRFKFDEFSSINGYFKCYKQNSKYKTTWFVILENDEGNWIINCPTHLKKLMDDLMSSEDTLLCEGDKILIKYCEDKYVGKPKPMKVFEVYTAQEDE